VNYPKNPKKSAEDEYHGIQVTDDYRWLEDASDPAVSQWTAEQNRFTRAYLDRIPARDDIYSRLEELYKATSSDYYALNYRPVRLFAIKWQPSKQQPLLVTLASADDLDSEKVVLDPNELDPSGSTAIDFFVPSLDGRFVAVSLSKGGSEEGTLYVYDNESGKALEDEIPRVNYPTAGGSVAWNADGTGFYYTRYPRGSERPPEDLNFFQQVYFHALATPTDQDIYVIGESFPRIAEIELEVTDDGSHLLVLVKNGDGGEMAHYVMDPDGRWTQITQFEDQIQNVALGTDGYIYMLSRQDAPRGKIIRLPLDNPVLSAAQTIVAQRPGAISHFESTDSRLYVVEIDGGPSRLCAFDHQGRELPDVPTEPVSSIWQIVRLDGDGILFRSGSFITPPAWYWHDPKTCETRRTALFVTSPADFSDCEVVREFATSKDSTQVPINIISRKETELDGRNPVLLNGYGHSLTPSFNVRRRVWLDQGGIIVIANLRGGGEYGEEWHKAGNLTNKQNVFDDFTACAQHLIQHHYTDSDHLCIEGGSNGGLLMGAAFTQHPELFRAIVSHVGLYDMLRVELDPNGAFNVTEFGTVSNPQHFEVLYDYSPYHRVVDGISYPAILMVTGENDGRVNPAQSRKMTARLQDATGSDRPILLRTSSTSGHGLGTTLDERIAEDADVFAFLFSQLEMEVRA
jgi:prolyl oligopeptidase